MEKSQVGESPSLNEAPRSKLRGITEHSFEDFSETELNPVASYGEYLSLRYYRELVCVGEIGPHIMLKPRGQIPND